MQMRFYKQVPAPPLSDFVELFWLYEGYRQPHKKERLLPDGSMELVVNLNEDVTRAYDPHDTGKFETLSGAVVAGPHSEFFVIDTAGQHTVAGVHFKPGGAFPFLGLPASELRNTLVSLDDLWGALAGQLRERLLQAGTPRAKFWILEQTLLARAAQRLCAASGGSLRPERVPRRAAYAHRGGRNRTDRPERQTIHSGVQRTK